MVGGVQVEDPTRLACLDNQTVTGGGGRTGGRPKADVTIRGDRLKDYVTLPLGLIRIGKTREGGLTSRRRTGDQGLDLVGSRNVAGRGDVEEKVRSKRAHV